MSTDPIQSIEKMVREIHDRAGKRAEPVLNRYPLVFAFLLAFSIAAILHGFDVWSDTVPLFQDHPVYLMLAGVLALILTGTLYKALEKMG